MTETQRIYAMLVGEAGSIGTEHVKAACKKFLKKPHGDAQRGPRPPIPKPWIEHAWQRQRYRCNICKQEMLLSEAAGDHIEPWSKGGLHAASNIAAVHDVKFGGTCNQEKGARGLIEESKRSGHLLTEMLPQEDDADAN